MDPENDTLCQLLLDDFSVLVPNGDPATLSDVALTAADDLVGNLD